MLGDAHSHQLGREPRVLPEPEQPDQLRAHVEHGLLPLQADRRGHPAAGAVRPGDGLLGHPEARRGAEVRQPEERVRRPVRADAAPDDPGRERRDPHQDGRHPLLPELVGPEQEGHARRWTARRSRSCTTRTSTSCVEEVGKLAGQFGAARIVIEGHTDGSMQRQVPKSAVQELSLNRANAVRKRSSESSRRCSRTSSRPSGLGWDRPADPTDPDNHAKNRRVEIKVYPAEAADGRSRCPSGSDHRCSSLRVSPAAAPCAAARRAGGAGAPASWCGGSRRSARRRDAVGLAGHPAEPGRSVRELPQPAERARAAAEHRRDAEARADRLRPRDRSSACRSASSPARGAWSKRPARRSRCSAATCRWPR